EGFFRAPLVFEKAHPELILRSSDLRLPMLRADRMLAHFFERHAAELLERISDLPAAVLRVTTVIIEGLHGRVPRLSDGATRLAMGTRTLRRRLDEYGTSFKSLVDEARSELAQQYLEESRHSIGEIAYLLGFSEPSAFYRAFKRWTTQAPAQF